MSLAAAEIKMVRYATLGSDKKSKLYVLRPFCWNDFDIFIKYLSAPAKASNLGDLGKVRWLLD